MVISLFPAPVQRYNDAVGKAPASQTAGHSAQGLSPSSDRYGPTSFGSDRHVSLWSGHLTQGLNPSSHRYGLASFGSDHHVSLSTQGLSPSSHRYGFHKLWFRPPCVIVVRPPHSRFKSLLTPLRSYKLWIRPLCVIMFRPPHSRSVVSVTGYAGLKLKS